MLFVCVFACALVSVPPRNQRLIAKYNYTAKANSPLGTDAEVNLTQMDKMTMIASHPQQEYWWLVEMDDGRRGYVPANYVTVCCFGRVLWNLFCVEFVVVHYRVSAFIPENWEIWMSRSKKSRGQQ